MDFKTSMLDLIGNTPLLKVESLSRLSGCNIFLKCENLNPGGSVKDRAALQMIVDAEKSGGLKPGMTIVEGTAGNTGIGLSLVARAKGYKMIVVMPKGQDPQKEILVKLYGGELITVDPVPFSNENHFFHRAGKIAKDDPNAWWANQFENLSNHRAHYLHTGPEIASQLDNKIDALVSVAGTGGTIGGLSKFFKENSKKSGVSPTKIYLCDPEGSGIQSFLETGKYESTGSSITEGIGIMRLVANFKEAEIDSAFTLPDQDLVTIAYHIREADGIVPGMSTALNLAGALKVALEIGPGKNIVTIFCDGGDRATNKLYDLDFLASKNLSVDEKIDDVVCRYKL